MAPELLKNVDYGLAVDIWSLGILLYELLHGYSPYRGGTDANTMGNILQGNLVFRKGICEEAQDLIKAMLNKAPSMRPTWSQIFTHKWVTKFQSQYNITKVEVPEKDNNIITILKDTHVNRASQVNMNDHHLIANLRSPYFNMSCVSTIANMPNKRRPLIASEVLNTLHSIPSKKSSSISRMTRIKSALKNTISTRKGHEMTIERTICMLNLCKENVIPQPKPKSILSKILSLIFE